MEDSKATPVGISLEKPLLAAGKSRAKEVRRSFSNHMARLLEADLIQHGWLTVDGRLTDKALAAIPNGAAEAEPTT